MSWLSNFIGGGGRGRGFDNQTFPGSFQAGGDSARLSKLMEALIGQNPSSSYDQPLRDALLNPSFTPSSQSEKSLLNSLSEMTEGANAVRGLGPATQLSLEQALAPALINMRQQNVGNLMNAYGMDTGNKIQSKWQNLQALNELIGLSMPQRVSAYNPGKDNPLTTMLMSLVGGAGQGMGAAGGAKLAAML